MAVAELSQTMGRQFDPQYFQQSIDAYEFLLKEYPGTKHRGDALFTIGQIQQEDLHQLDAAEVTFHDFLQRYPQSDKAEAAQVALQKIADTREKESHPGSSAKVAIEMAKESSLPQVTSIRTWNAENYTRIVVEMEDTVKYQAARIKNPDRIYFDLDHAKLSPALAGKTFELQNGFLKGIRVAQNQKGVVRIVLDVDSVKDYSAFLLPNPYRLVIDVHGKAEPVGAAHTGPRGGAGMGPPSAAAGQGYRDGKRADEARRETARSGTGGRGQVCRSKRRDRGAAAERAEPSRPRRAAGDSQADTGRPAAADAGAGAEDQPDCD